MLHYYMYNNVMVVLVPDYMKGLNLPPQNKFGRLAVMKVHDKYIKREEEEEEVKRDL